MTHFVQDRLPGTALQMAQMKRRDILKGTFAAGATLALASRLPATPITVDPRGRTLAKIAQRELARAPADVLWHRDIVGIADFGVHSATNRFHFVNLERGTVDSYLVSHGTGSDPEHDGWLNNFSNVHGSNATSRGAYASRNWYTGQYGTSVRLLGLDPTNDNALDRAIVMHRASYAEPEHVDRWGRLGRSNGCLAMGEEQFRRALLELAGGRLIYADRLGIGPDGQLTFAPSPQLDVLRREDGTTAERINPGAY